MTQEEKSLLLKDLCARVPYGVICACEKYNGQLKFVCPDGDYCFLQISPYAIETIKPYLRPMSSMTKEERDELEHLSEEYFGKALDKQIQESLSSLNRNESEILEYIASSAIVDWLIAHHFDFRGLIEKGLAIEVTKENNPYEN